GGQAQEEAVVTAAGRTVASRIGAFAATIGIDPRRPGSAAERRLARGIDEGLERVEALLGAELSFADVLADTTARYLYQAGGKRVRPVLALLAAQFGVGITDEVIRAAASVELTHLGSLYHDDVMDSA